MDANKKIGDKTMTELTIIIIMVIIAVIWKYFSLKVFVTGILAIMAANLLFVLPEIITICKVIHELGAY